MTFVDDLAESIKKSTRWKRKTEVVGVAGFSISFLSIMTSFFK